MRSPSPHNNATNSRNPKTKTKIHAPHRTTPDIWGQCRGSIPELSLGPTYLLSFGPGPDFRAGKSRGLCRWRGALWRGIGVGEGRTRAEYEEGGNPESGFEGPFSAFWCEGREFGGWPPIRGNLFFGKVVTYSDMWSCSASSVESLCSTCSGDVGHKVVFSFGLLMWWFWWKLFFG